MSTNETIRETIEVSDVKKNALALIIQNLLDENQRYREALERIVEGAPTEDPHLIPPRGTVTDALGRSDASRHFDLAQIARAAIKGGGQ